MIIAVAGVALVVVTGGRVRARLGGRRHAPLQRGRRRRSPLPTAEDWAALLDSVSAEARTGSSLSVALRHAMEATGFHGRAIVGGCSPPLVVPSALHPDEAIVVHAINATYALGGSISPTLDSAAALLRERVAVRAEALAHSAQARLSARVLTVVPLLFATWSVASSESFRAGLLHPVGAISACAGGVLNASGWWWMRHIVDGSVS